MSAHPLPRPPFDPQDILAFWRKAGSSSWFRKDDGFDAEFRDRFLAMHEAAARGDLDAWSDTADGALSLCLLLDQFPRNSFRGTPRMFATDAKAREMTRTAIERGFDTQVESELRQFFYLPFMHSERLDDQDLCVELTGRIGPDSQRWALHHREIIQRFGRFPHRNEVLGRASTPEEEAFLAEGGFGG